MSKYLIINADDFGMCHSANMAIKDLFENRIIKSTSIITVSNWAKEATDLVLSNPDLYQVGVHITHTSEWESYRWHGFLDIKSLKDKDDMFFKKTSDVYKAPIEDRVKEAKAQIAWAINRGLNINHIDNHMHTLNDHPIELLKLAYEYNIGVRFPLKEIKDKEALDYLNSHKVTTIDYLNYNDGLVISDNTHLESHFNMYKHMLEIMKDGINEWYMHPSLETDEIKAIAPDYLIRVNDYKFLKSKEFKELLKENNIELIGYDELRMIRS